MPNLQPSALKPSATGSARIAQARDGLLTGLPLILAVAPFALVVGALAVQSGFTSFEAALMSASVYAGASQLVAIELYGARVPLWSIVLAVFAVNVRHLLYSAAMTPLLRGRGPIAKALTFFFLVDPQFAFAQRRYETSGTFSLTWYLALAGPVFLSWVLLTLLGATFGQRITDPHALGIDLLLPVYFLALVIGFRSRPRWSIAVTASAVVAAIVYVAPSFGVGWLGPPWHVTLGALAGVLAASLSVTNRPTEGPPERSLREGLGR